MRSSSSLSILTAALLASPALAFRDTSPLLLWNTDPSRAFEEASKLLSGSALAPADEVYGKLSSLGCYWQNVVVVHKDQLHSSQLANLDYPTDDAHLHIPYLTRPHKRGLDDGLQGWAESCGAEVVSSFDERVQGQKNVILIESAEGESFPSIPSSLPEPYILLLTGSSSSSSSSSQEKRQERPFPTHITDSASATTTLSGPTSTSTSEPSSRPNRNSTIPSKDAPLLERVQLLTTPIITSLLITFGIFLPILGFGISMLTSIQVPPRMLEIGKSLSVGKDRKDQ
ncbi:hypothetical protein L486_00927 [Kwoniella mangroviensis CBS 10435]|uniref:Protein BIG1 n=1 Tax=Kwoniella mangroviensis CBS 10435 TaxID=1331196 RepID=A0A1B9J0G6_9TREE|nr:uncharacterized protein I203_06146 [Kwoniella mangroviensis CBS 8507]OCF61280.1 hypothetical protein L486_00927 [Kwoniella mangroviensis CBS 10435]OCF64901.1 hypothetical protein I203_06146 [Kwoniella mangroviensis CBS 8507]OCF77299.1 hypothetical protein I204_01286 [Kwoniella mangroviensis CBS 8886]